MDVKVVELELTPEEREKAYRTVERTSVEGDSLVLHLAEDNGDDGISDLLARVTCRLINLRRLLWRVRRAAKTTSRALRSRRL